MHVVHLYDGHEKVYDGRGSVPSVVWNLARETVDDGHEVTVVERQWAGLERSAEREGVAFERLSLRSGSDEPWTDLPYEMVGSPVGAARLLLDRANFARAAHGRLADLDPDVVHAHLPFAANVLATLRPGFRDSLVYTAHLGETEDRVVDPRFSPDAHLAKRTARTIALNPSMYHAFAERGVPEDRLDVIPNGVDLDQFSHVGADDRAAVRERYDLDPDDVVVLFVGTVTPRKGVLELAEALADALPATDGAPPETDGDARALLVGKADMEPEYVDRVRGTVADAGLEDRVTLTGFVEESTLEALFDVADAFVLPSHEEGSSISVAEAMAAELPVVGTRIDGIRQQVEHGENGLLCTPGDVDALADHVETLIRDDAARERMSEAMAERATDWSWDSVTRDVVDVYEEVAAS